MSTYNENEHAALIDLLSNFENRKNTIVRLCKEANQSLHNAQLATYFTEQEYDETGKNILTKETIIKKATECNQAGKNALEIVTHLKECSNMAITQASVTASHIQRASNDILLITSYMGSLYNIMQASDFNTELFILSEQVFKKMEEVAMLSEKASQLSMEISANTAEVPAPILLNKITYSNSLLDGLLKKLNDSQQEAKGEWANKATTLAENKNTEALAEGIFKNISAVKDAINETYTVTNEILNQQLEVKVTGADLVISFNIIQTPFKEEKTEQSSTTNAIYPVKDYFLFFVKDHKKTLFDLHHAEDIVANKKTGQYIQINPELTGKTIKIDKRLITFTIDTGNLKYKDSEGDTIEANTNYVVFLMAVYDEKYQRSINQFDAYLSAPALPFYIAKKSTDSKKSKDLNKQLNSFVQEIKNSREEIDILEATLSDLNKKIVWLQNTQIKTRIYGNSILEYRNNLLQIIETVNDLNNNENMIRLDVIAANTKIKQLTKIVDELLKKLLFTIKMVDKLSNKIMKQKAVNPLISDDIVKNISVISKNSNLAMNVSLLALQHTFSTFSAGNELIAISKQTQLHLNNYYRLLADDKKKQISLSYLINLEQKETEQHEKQLIKDIDMLQVQIEKTNSALNKARAKYQSNESAQQAIKQLG